MRFSGLETHTATFEAEQQIGTEDDAYGDPEPVYDWVAVAEAVPVRFEPAGQGFVLEESGEHTRRSARLFVTEPDRLGETTTAGHFQPVVASGDRVAIDGLPGRYRLTFVRVRSLDASGPEYIEIEIEQVD